MVEILKYCAKVLKDIFAFWMSVDIGGFRPFWFFAGCALLSGLGGALIGFGELGGTITRVAAKSGVKSKVKFMNEGNFKRQGKKIVARKKIIKKYKYEWIRECILFYWIFIE